MTGAELLAYVKRSFKRTDKDDEIYEAMTDVVADVRIQLKTEDYKEEAFIGGVAALGDYKVAVPLDFQHLIGDVTVVDDGNCVKTLEKISKQAYDRLYGDRLHSAVADSTSGFPIHYCIYAQQIFLGPVPDSTSYVYQINYTTELYTAITASTDPVPFSEMHRTMLRAGILAEVYAGVEFFDESNYWREIYRSELLKLNSLDANNIADTQGVAYNGI